jgi:F-type H+-transporting ATPase subunit b
MLIDWWTVAAQIVNFLILLWLLKVFLYGRVVEAMNAREQRIADEFEKAESRQTEAENMRKTYENALDDIEDKRRETLDEAREEANAERHRILEEARQEAETRREQWQEALAREKDAVENELAGIVSRQVRAISQRVMTDMTGPALGSCLVDSFLERIADIEQEDRRRMAEAASEAGGVTVLTGHELEEKARERIAKALREHVAEGLEVDFQTEEEVVGVVVKARGVKLGWDLDSYLGRLSREVEEVMDHAEPEEAGEVPKAEQELTDEGEHHEEART